MALDTWDPRAAAAGTPIGFPSLTTGYPQPPSPPNPPAYTDPVTRPAPTISNLSPATAVAAGVGVVTTTVTGTNFTNATHFNFQATVDSPRIVGVQYISPTSMKLSLNLAGLPAAAYPVIAVNQDGQVSAGSNFTLT